MILSNIFLFFGIALLRSSFSIPLNPGQPGGEWSSDEIDIVRDKVIRMIKCSDEAGPIGWNLGTPLCWLGTDLYSYDIPIDAYTKDLDDFGPRSPHNYWFDYFAKWSERRPTPSRLIQLAFHDCLRYEDGTGGCDGCLNWSGMGWKSKGMDFFTTESPQYRATPVQYHTTNNKLQMSARSLELIYTNATWPPGALSLPESLKESGKSRADLWQFAGNIALEMAINITNDSGKKVGLHNSETNLCAQIGKENCVMTLDRYIPFRTGRKDCIRDLKSNWTTFEFEATSKERHSNSYGTGSQAVDDLKKDFNLTARESIALFALHGMAVMGRNPEEALKYKWIGGSIDQNNMKTTFSNMYHKILNGKSYDRGILQLFDDTWGFRGYFIGDAKGDPVGGTGYYFKCHMYWNNTGRHSGGPCHFKPTTPGCSNVLPTDNPDLQPRYPCFTKEENGDFTRDNTIAGCQNAEIFDRDGFKIQRGGPPNPSCQGGWTFLLPYEMSLVLDFKVDEKTNLPYGCGTLDGDWKYDKDGPGVPMYDGSSYPESESCGKVTYDPEGEGSLPNIVEEFADDHDIWQKTFFNAWEKLQLNGYNLEDLKEAPVNGQLMASFMSNR